MLDCGLVCCDAAQYIIVGCYPKLYSDLVCGWNFVSISEFQMRATRHYYRRIFDLITLNDTLRDCKLWSSLFCNFPIFLFISLLSF